MNKSTKNTYGYLGTEPLAFTEQIDQLATALQDLAKAEGVEAIEAAKQAAQRVAEQANAVSRTLGEKMGTVGDAAAKGRSLTEEAIRRQPLAAVSLALATGFVLALLVRR